VFASAINRAIQDLFGVDEARNNGGLDLPGCHYKILSLGTQRKIKDRAFRYMIRDGVFGAISRLYNAEREERDDG